MQRNKSFPWKVLIKNVYMDVYFSLRLDYHCKKISLRGSFVWFGSLDFLFLQRTTYDAACCWIITSYNQLSLVDTNRSLFVCFVFFFLFNFVWFLLYVKCYVAPLMSSSVKDSCFIAHYSQKVPNIRWFSLPCNEKAS